MIVNESGLSRIWTIANNPEYAFGIISASRGSLTAEENDQRHRVLQNSIRSAGFGFLELTGYFIENYGTPEEMKVKEKSFFIPTPIQKEADLYRFLNLQTQKFGQDGYIMKEDGEVTLVFKDGKREKIGQFNPDKTSYAYSVLNRGSHAGRSFVFESATEASTWLQAMSSHASRATSAVVIATS